MRPHVALLLIAFLSTTAFTFAQEASNSASAIKSVSNAGSPSPLISGTGTTDHITKWLTSTSLGSSGIFETSTGNVGIGTTAPAAKFDVKGTGNVRDTLTLFPSGTHPTLSISGTAFQVSNNGKVSFVPGQTFPGAGTVTTINSGTGLIGGPIHTSGILSVNPAVVPLLANSNVFTANQTINGFLLTDFVYLNGSNGGGFIGEGGNPTAGQPGNSLTVFGGSPSSPATNVAGGDLILEGGTGFGAGGSGAVRIQTEPAGPSGTNPPFVDRQIFAPASTAMTSLGSGSYVGPGFVLNIANGDGGGATLRFTIRATDGGSNYAVAYGSCSFAAVVAPDGSSEANALLMGADYIDAGSSGDHLNASCGSLTGGSNQYGIFLVDSPTFAPSTHDVYFEINNVSGSPVAPGPQARVHMDLSQRVDALHPKLVIHRGH
ncbi:MAG: hypothetical protein JOY93_12655 [Acidobacteriales bacterium]|nr:hypothetical protein [Terriglobales bacterium]